MDAGKPEAGQFLPLKEVASSEHIGLGLDPVLLDILAKRVAVDAQEGTGLIVVIQCARYDFRWF